jgi:hypothetical protein
MNDQRITGRSDAWMDEHRFDIPWHRLINLSVHNSIHPFLP